MVEEAALVDLDVEEVPDAGGSKDALGGPTDLAGVDESPGADPLFEGQQLGLGAGDEFGGAQRVAAVPVHVGDDDGASPILERDVAGRRVGGGHRHAQVASARTESCSASAQVGSRWSRVAST